MKPTLPSYCGNSPKMQLIADFNLAFAAGDIQKVLSYMHDDIQWEMLGDQFITGHEAVAAFINEHANLQVVSWEVEDILSHGKLGSARGTVQLDKQIIHFADFYTFTSTSANAKIKEIKTLAISKPRK
jgi:hypothetical protein